MAQVRISNTPHVEILQQISGTGVPLAPQDRMRGHLRRYELNALVSRRPQVDALEQRFSPPEQDRRDSNVQLINQRLAKILPDRGRSAADPHVPSGSRLACTIERVAYASGTKWNVVPPLISIGGRA
jgi:hypothetical protein